MDVVKVDIDRLIDAWYNPRKDLQVEDVEYQNIKNSIEEFGYVEPIIINSDMTIIGGHQRVKVLKDLGFEKIDCVKIDISKEKEKVLNIALNKISGSWDEELLKVLLKDIDEDDLGLTGFGQDELDELLNNFIEEEEEIEEFEYQFTEELLEEHNYLVFYFDNQLDWQVMIEKFGIKTVKALDSRKGYERKGVGRVISGKKLLELLDGDEKND